MNVLNRSVFVTKAPRVIKRSITSFILFLGLLAIAHTSLASSKRINLGTDSWVEVGAGLRFDWAAVEDGAPNGDDYSDDFTMNRADVFISGRANRFLEFTLNTTYDSISEDFDLREGIIRFEHSDTLNIWAGRFMVPTDLSSLSTVFHQTRWFPVSGAFLRDEGVAIWGGLDQGRFQYKAGVFDGFEVASGYDAEDLSMLAGRFRINFWDPISGYYTQSTYYGEKNILSAGVSVELQRDAFAEGIGPLEEVGDFQGVSADVLYEAAASTGLVITFQATAYSYDTDDITITSTSTELAQSSGFELMGAVLLQQQNGDSLGGRIQPTISLQSYDLDLSDEDGTRLEFGVKYIQPSHDAKVSAAFASNDVDTATGSEDFISFMAGVQLML